MADSQKPLVIKTVIITLCFVVLFVSVVVISIALSQRYSGQSADVTQVLGDVVEKVPIGGDTPMPSSTVQPSPTFPLAPSVTPLEQGFSVSVASYQKRVLENDPITFTWTVNGPNRTIKTSSIYYGIVSVAGNLSRDIAPGNTIYNGKLPDFLNGKYYIPLQFVGSVQIPTAGTYYARGYALVDGKHYWSEEFSFIVDSRPKSSISVVDYPKNSKINENSSFTWEITGPNSTTGYTVIVGGKESKPGQLSEATALTDTPYQVLVNDFTSGEYQVPYRFIGNVVLGDPGTYYFRALAFINGKNIWSEEYSMVVE